MEEAEEGGEGEGEVEVEEGGGGEGGEAEEGGEAGGGEAGGGEGGEGRRRKLTHCVHLLACVNTMVIFVFRFLAQHCNQFEDS